MIKERHFTLRLHGREYRQDFLPVDKALRLYHRVVRLGATPLAEAAAKALEKGGPIEPAKLSDELLGALYQLIQTVEVNDIDYLYEMLAQHTWITTGGDGPAADLRLDTAKGHFADARDVFRLLHFVAMSVVEQMRPFADDLRTTFGRRA